MLNTWLKYTSPLHTINFNFDCRIVNEKIMAKVPTKKTVFSLEPSDVTYATLRIVAAKSDLIGLPYPGKYRNLS